MRKGFLVISALLFLACPRNVRADDEFEYLTKCVQAEAGIEDLKGKRLVAAVILNRVEDERFPDTITEVIDAPKQFAVVANGTINEVEADDETILACQLEMQKRTDEEIFYFNNSPKISGKFCYKWGKHYFGK